MNGGARRGGQLGLPRVHARLLDSTNAHAKSLAQAGAPHGALVTADEQSAGRGRQGRSWTAPPGRAVLMSLVLRGLREDQSVLPLAAAVGVCEAAEAVAPVACEIKWPNDVWIARRKLAGILVEARPGEDWAVLGVGLNVSTREFPAELADTATSLALAAPADLPRNRPAQRSSCHPYPGSFAQIGGRGQVERVLAELLAALSRRLAQDPAEVLAAWRARDALVGQPVRWGEGQGTASGIDDSGALLVDTATGRVALEAGEVHLLR